jgi:hypothetical protein
MECRYEPLKKNFSAPVFFRKNNFFLPQDVQPLSGITNYAISEHLYHHSLFIVFVLIL